MLKTIIWRGAVTYVLILGSSGTSFSQQVSPTPAPAQQATIEASPLPTIVQAPKRNRLPGWTVVRLYSDAYTSVKKGLSIEQFVKYLDDGSCSTPPCSLSYIRLWDSIDSYSSSKFPDGETSYCFFSDGEMNEYRPRIFVHGDRAWNYTRLYKAFHFPFKPIGKWSWAFTDVGGANFSVTGESLGWVQPAGGEDLPWRTVHFRVHGTCINLCTFRSPDFRAEFYYAPEIGTVVWRWISGGYASVLNKTKDGQWMAAQGKLPPLPPRCQL